MLLNRFFLLVSLITVLSGCDSNSNQEDTFSHSLNLLEYGIPLSLMTPDSFSVQNSSTSLMQELKVTAKDYLIYVYGYDMGGQVQSEKSRKLAEVREDPYSDFGAIIQEKKNGFVYSIRADKDTTVAYNFHRYFRISNKIYHLTSSAGGRRPPFSRQQMIDMFKATENN